MGLSTDLPRRCKQAASDRSTESASQRPLAPFLSPVPPSQRTEKLLVAAGGMARTKPSSKPQVQELYSACSSFFFSSSLQVCVAVFVAVCKQMVHWPSVLPASWL
mmetsp:Transcript_12415/g.24021  ORF Transcript_12415/g.24021 Transcript_12415/m.24021 type:complete len:105 (-) Transcript_12415:569-883(-)